MPHHTSDIPHRGPKPFLPELEPDYFCEVDAFQEHEEAPVTQGRFLDETYMDWPFGRKDQSFDDFIYPEP